MATNGMTAAPASQRLATVRYATADCASQVQLRAQPVTAGQHAQPLLFQVYFEWLRHRYQREERRGMMRRTLGEWEKLWRERWDINDYADLDQVFANTQDCKDAVCEVEIILETQEGRIETVQISLLDSEFTVLAGYKYSIYELGRVELVQEVIASMNSDPEDEEAETLPESKS